MIMEGSGDILTNPNWTWHDHNNFGTEPMIWGSTRASMPSWCNIRGRQLYQNWAEEGTQPVIRAPPRTCSSA